MAPSMQVTQLARLLGRSDLLTWDLESPGPRAELERAVEDGFDRLTQGVLEEAAASDDVVDAASADAFIDDRLAFLGDLLTGDQRRRLREACRRVTEGWG